MPLGWKSEGEIQLNKATSDYTCCVSAYDNFHQ